MEIDVDVRPCDVLERQVVEDVPTGAIIYTSATLCMLPEIPYRFLERMCELSPREVIHFEPIVEHFEDDELGRLRRDYIDTHDYNTNLRTILAAGETAGLLTIVEEEATVVGENCLLPLSVIVWKPA
jgi:hypothetical protein